MVILEHLRYFVTNSFYRNLRFFGVNFWAQNCGRLIFLTNMKSASNKANKSLLLNIFCYFATIIVIWLFIAMGLPWTLDLVSGYLHHSENDITILLIDMITALQGFLIFLIYTLKFGLQEKLAKFLRRLRPGEKPGRKLSVESNTKSLALNSCTV